MTTQDIGVVAEASAPAADVLAAAARPAGDVLHDLGVTADHGRTEADVVQAQARWGPNAVSSHRARVFPVLWHQLRSPLLGLLLAAALASALFGQRGDAIIIAAIVIVSVGLGFTNEYRAEEAAEALHSRIRHETTVIRDGTRSRVDVTTLVPGDVVELRLGDVVPGDLRLLSVTGLECDESVLTGESLPVDKSSAPVMPGTPLAELSGAALMGTVVRAGSGVGVVVATGARTQFGSIAAGLDTPARHRVPGRPAQVLHAPGLRRRLAHRGDLPGEHPAEQAAPRRAAVLTRDRGRYHSATATRRGLDQSRRRVATDEPPECSGQTAGLHRGPRQCRRAVHRQDRNAHPGQHPVHAGGASGDGRPGRDPAVGACCVPRLPRAPVAAAHWTRPCGPLRPLRV
jgi:hypothetical protein